MLARVDDAETDRGPRDLRSSPERFCVATRQARPADDLMRFVVGPDGALTPDVKRKLPGRGVWVTATRAALDLAVKRQAFRKSLKSDVTVPATLAAIVDGLLEQAVLDSLSIARKGSAVVLGFTKVESALAAGEAAVLIHASDASPGGVSKLAGTVRRRAQDDAGAGHPPVGLAIVDAFTTSQLDLALGRLNVVHAALPRGRAAETLIARWRILARFRGDGPEMAGTAEPNELPETRT